MNFIVSSQVSVANKQCEGPKLLYLFFKHFFYHSKCHLALLISWILPRSKKIWVVGGSRGLRFADNSKHFAILAMKKWPEQKIIWLSPSQNVRNLAASKGLLAYHPSSLKGLWYGFRAQWHIFDIAIYDTSEFSVIGAKQLNLWHGVTLKSLGVMNRHSKITYQSKFHDWWYRKNTKYNYFLYPNKKHTKYLSELFKVPMNNMILVNLPRNELLLKKNKSILSSDELATRKNITSRSPIIIGYFPTWRNTGQDKFLGFSSAHEIQCLNTLLNKYNATLVTKWHTCSYEEYQHQGVSQTAQDIDSEINKADRIMKLPFDCDLTAVLDCFDLLISDYSSVMIDYLLLERPILQVPYDLKEYESLTGFMEDYHHFSKKAGPNAKSTAEVLNILEGYLQNPSSLLSDFRDNIVDLKEYYFETLETLTPLEIILNPIK